MLDFCKEIINKIDNLDEQVRQQMYECLILIFNRGEFDLNNMGFTNDYKNVLQNNNKVKEASLKKHIDKKIKVSLKYQNLLYKTLLNHVLPKLTATVLSSSERKFIENFLVIAFFRIPEFQDELINKFDCMNDSQDLEFEEWSQYEFNTQNVFRKQKTNRCKTNWIFDWNKEFYTFLET